MTTDTTLPSLSRTDKNGVSWTFDPGTGRWSADASGKKFNGKDFSTVSSRVFDWNSSQKNPELHAKLSVKPAAPVEAGVLFLNSGIRQRGFFYEDVKATPGSVRVEWSPRDGSSQIVRKKIAGNDGWSQCQSGFDRPLAFHPRHMSDEMLDFVKKALMAAHCRREFEGAEKAIQQGWWEGKPDRTITLQNSRNGLEPVDKSQDHWQYRRAASIISELPFIDLTTNQPPVGWVAADDGSMAKQGVSIHLNLDGQVPQFDVVSQTHPGTLYQSDDLVRALNVAQATIDTQQNAFSQFWNANEDWIDKNPTAHGQSPQLYSISAMVAIARKPEQQRGDRAEIWYFGQLEAHPYLRHEQRSCEEQDKRPMWRRAPTGNCFKPAGDDDAQLQAIAQLRKAYEVLPVTLGIEPPTPDKIDALFNETARGIYNSDGDGEPWPKDPAGAASSWETLRERLEQEIQSHPGVIAWTKQCAQARAMAETAPRSVEQKHPRMR